MQSLNAASTRIGGRKRRTSSSDDEQEAGRTQRRRINEQYTEFLTLRRDESQNCAKSSNDRQPKKLVQLAIDRKTNSEEYVAALKEISTDAPTHHQVTQLNVAKLRGPHYLGRTISRSDGYKFDSFSRGTNGYTEQEILMPAADTREDQAVHSSITSMTQGELQYMLGRHLIWDDSPSDEFLSYSIDPLFLVYHALGRHHKGQSHVTIQFFDRRRASAVDQQPAAFYHAIDLYNIFKAPGWTGWSDIVKGKLLPRKFTQEYLSHCTTVVRDDRFRQAKLQDLIDDGLYDIFPAFKVPSEMKRAGLYTGQVILRRIGYPPPPRKTPDDDPIYAYGDCRKKVPFTQEILAKVRKVTMHFMGMNSKVQNEEIEPHLHIFLCFLTFQKRPKRDAVFLDWIKKHYTGKPEHSWRLQHHTNNITAQDVQDLYLDSAGNVEEGYTRVANNLPGVMQYLDLVRDAGYAFDLPELPANKVEVTDELTGRNYAAEDDRLNRGGSLWYRYDADVQKKNREKNKQKRKMKKDQSEDKESNASMWERDENSVESGSDEDAEDEEDEESVVRDDEPSTFGTGQASDEDDEDQMMQTAIAASLDQKREESSERAGKEKATQSGAVGSMSGSRKAVGESLDRDEEEAMVQMAIAASLDPGLLGGGDGGRRAPSREQTPYRETERRAPAM